jgi:hypothetical protein
MAIPFERIEQCFVELRDFVLNDLDRIASQDIGGNFAACAVVVCAYDAIAALRDDAKNAGEVPFCETLPPEWQPVAPSLYDALRNGIVHTYATQKIHVGGRDIGLSVAWRGERHLTFDGDWLIIVVPDLAAGLHRAFARFEEKLRADAAQRDLFFTRYRRDSVHNVRAPDEQEAWRRLLDDAGT